MKSELDETGSRFLKCAVQMHPGSVESCRPLDSQLQDVPQELHDLIWRINSLVIPREMYSIPHTSSASVENAASSNAHRSGVTRETAKQTSRQQETSGMSIKKAHEVERMASYVAHMLSAISETEHIEIEHVVDVGAGQVNRFVSNFSTVTNAITGWATGISISCAISIARTPVCNTNGPPSCSDAVH